MRSEHIFHLSRGWAVFADDRQWILSSSSRAVPVGDIALAGERWRHLCYIGTSKRILERCIREKGTEVDEAGQRELDALPDTFAEWRLARDMPRAA